jgi:ribonuclease BN (tRNA processing enzyme)
VRLVPLGTNGFFPSFGRQTMSFLVFPDTGGESAILLDAGTGVARLAEPEVAAALAGIECLEIVLSHYHLDHVVGLAYLPGVWRGRRARLWAPAPPLVDGSPAALARFLEPPLFPTRLAEFPLALEIVPYGAESLELCGMPIRLRRQQHPGGSVGMRFGDALAYVTDTGLAVETEDFARGVQLLLHEVWLTEAEIAAGAPGSAGHSPPEAVAALARRAGVGQLLPVHHHPRRSPTELVAMAAAMAARSGVATLVAEEGSAISL